MNGKQRIARAMQHQLPDRVPVMCQLAIGHYFVNLRDRWQPHEIWFTSEAFADSLVALQQQYHFDGILVNMPGRDPDWMRDVAAIESDELEQVITWKDGLHTVIPWDDNAQYEPDDPSLAPRPAFDDFDPDADMDRLDEWPRYTWGVYHTPHLPGKAPGPLRDVPDYFLRTIDLVQAAAGDSVSVHGEVFSPFTHFMELFGYQEALLGLVTDTAKAEAILAQFVEPAVAWGRAQAARGVDAVLISSAFAGGGFISPRMYKRFVVPFERAVVEGIHAQFPETPVYTHTCGKLGDRLELLIESGTQGVDTLDPPPLGDTELAEARRIIDGRIFIKGNMNSVALLDDTEAEVRERARRAVEVGKGGGGYILSSACSVAPHVAPWKLELLVDVVNEYGRYDA